MDLVKSIIAEAYKPVKKRLSRTPAALDEGLGKISRHIQMGNIYVALVGELVVGTMRVSMSGTVGVIERLAVRSKFRKRSIGTLMVEYAENLLEHMNATCVEIEVYGYIEYQGTFFQRLGYVETKRLKRNKEEIIVMMKDLREPEVVEEEDL
ncbi:MAG: GNAT family N-acetyltransferase [Candidatus Thorarchaeota archaeon]|nr:MAG: GNAT family N-acetyltransferase [Candidatus Thorarchaeota archaeon]